MNHRSVAYALVAKIIDSPLSVNNEDLSGHVVFENDMYVPSKGQTHVQCHWRPGGLQSAIDGVAKWERGTMRFEGKSELKDGATILNELADQIMLKYPITSRLARGDWVVTILGLARSAATRAGSFRRMYVDVTYHAVNANAA